MSTTAPPTADTAPGWRLRLTHLAAALLIAWAVALGVAAVRLHHWQQDVSAVLLQLRADDLLRASVGQDPGAIDAAWYRERAIGLLAAVERMREDSAWRWAMPGAWSRWNALEDRAAAHIAKAFGVVVVETIERELAQRTQALTGSPSPLAGATRRPPQAPAAAAVSCAPPPARAVPPRGAAVPAPGRLDALPEYAALATFLREATFLDRGLARLQALRQPGGAGPDDLAELVRYTLGAQLPGPSSRSTSLFLAAAQEAARDGASPDAAAGPVARLPERAAAALRCSLEQGFTALHARWYGGNELVHLEEALQRTRPARVFERLPHEDFAAHAGRIAAVTAQLERQQALLAAGDTGWMRSPTPELGPAHAQLLQQVAALHLLGPQAANDLAQSTATAHAQLRRRLESLLDRPASGLAWDGAAGGRLVATRERADWATGLSALMREPFMAQAFAPAAPARLAGPAAGVHGLPHSVTADAQLAAALPPSIDPGLQQAQLLQLAAQRRAFVRGSLQRFPPRARAAVLRFADERLAQLAYEQAAPLLAAQVQPALGGPPATLGGGGHAELAGRIDALHQALADAGAPALALRLRARLERDVIGRMDATEAALRALPLFGRALEDFSHWSGDAPPLASSLGLVDAGGLQRFMADQAQRLEAAAQAIPPAPDAVDPAQARWSRLRTELARYRLGEPDSTLLALEQYLQAVAPDLRRDNCIELLSAQAVPSAPTDEIAQRHVALHRGLLLRCAELRAQAPS